MGLSIKIIRNRRGRADSKSIVLINKLDEQVEISYSISKIKKRDYQREFREVMREVIRPQITLFRKAEFKNHTKLLCPITNKEFSIDESEVDHVDPTFENLIRSFISKYSISIDQDLFPKPEEFDGTYRLNDRKFMELFSKYHGDNSKLQVLSRIGHKIKTAKG